LVRLIEELSRKKNCSQVFIRKPGFSLIFKKRTLPTRGANA
jgi:hypothetical protein